MSGYAFLPWVRRGLARSIAAPDDPQAVLAGRVTLPVTLRVDGAGDVSTTIRLFGPGDVVALAAGEVARTDPRPGTTNFEAAYLPQAQFARADLPWLFTPASPSSDGARLRPWLVLVAVRLGDGVKLTPADPLPVLDLANAAAELPDLRQSWAWAHAQIAGAIPTSPADVLAAEPGRACSRLLCPRRLEPDTAYLACVVPAFAAGVQSGLGETPDVAALAPAWTPDTTALRLPVYHSWTFTTGPAGSFETLVRKLHPAPLDPASARPPKLDLRAPGGGLPAFDPTADGSVVELESALRVPGPDAAPPWPDATRVPFQAALEQLVTTAPPDEITAPLYGQAQARANGLPAEGTEPAWLRELNLDPRLRVAAAVGTQVVQQRQEELMARAWEQAGAVREANDRLRRSQLARELGGTLIERHFQRFEPAELLAVTQPAHASIALTGETVDAELRGSRVPEAIVSGAMRRIAAPQGLIARRAAQTAAPDLLGAVERLASSLAAVLPIGMVTAAPATGAPTEPEQRPPLSADSLQVRLLDRLRPETTVLDRTRTAVDAPDGTWARPDPLATAALGPVFEEPMYDGLQDVAPALLLPGVADVEPDGVALLETDPRVIEAYLAGLNHEMSRELLWREFPADLSATAFRQFWDVRGQPCDPAALVDIPPIADWAGTALGAHLRGAGAQLVLLVRGELLRRYPVTTIFAAQALPDGTLDASTRLAPIFRGAIAPDIVFVGFALGEEAALGADPAGPGWYFAFEEHPGEPRFGFDEVAGEGVPQTPDDLAWAHVALDASGHVDLTTPLLSAGTDLQAAWGHEAGGMARLTLQQPFRTAMHASRLIRRPA